jgi:hypothetical protein
MARFNYQRVKSEVHDYCSMADLNTFDEQGIVAALRKMAYDNDCDIDSIDDVDPDAFEVIVQMHDTGYYTTIA